MNAILLETIVILVLLLANGLFSMSEIAVVSARKAWLRQRAETGDARARAALALAEDPSRFLATVQIGITLVGTLAAAFGGATLAEELQRGLEQLPGIRAYAGPVSLVIVVAAITVFTLVIGELVPKRLGLANPEGVASLIAGPMTALARLAAPGVNLLTWATGLVVRMLGLKTDARAVVTDDEVKTLVREGTRAGVFHPTEPAMVEGVLSLDRLPVRDLMTPRAKIIWVSVDEPHEVLWHKVVVSGHSTFPVYEGSRDRVVGVITVKAIYANLAAGVMPKVRDLMTPPLVVPASQTAVTLLETFKRTGRFVALVADEFGVVVGLLTLHDIMEAILGELPTQQQRLAPRVARREDGSWLVDAAMDVQAFRAAVPGFQLPASAGRDYHTFAGFVVEQLGQVPAEGASFPWQGYRVEVIDMDGHRVDKVLLWPLASGQPPAR